MILEVIVTVWVDTNLPRDVDDEIWTLPRQGCLDDIFALPILVDDEEVLSRDYRVAQRRVANVNFASSGGSLKKLKKSMPHMLAGIAGGCGSGTGYSAGVMSMLLST